nr:DNA primase domain containing protein [Haemonchus contortus]
MSRRSNVSDSNESEAKCDDSFNDSVHLNDLWFYGPPKKRQMLSPHDSQGDVVPPSVRCKRASLVEKSFGELETFPKQRLALAKFEEHAKVFKNTRLFSFEMPGHAGGERRYVVSTLERFWLWYISLSERHVYELIVDSMPCRLYFDLEYCKEINPGIDHEVAYRFFMTTVQDLLKKEFGLEVDPYKDFLVLDSSTENKFSAHVICHLPGGVLFPSNTSMRPFCARLADKLLENPPVRIWNTDATKETVLFDSAVYSKNRNFRLFLSSKLGKNAVLKLATYCSFYGVKKPSDQQIFYDSLCIPANAHKSSVLEISEDGQCELTLTRECAMPLLSSENGSGRSPYPQLDEFMIMIWRKWSPSVFIRQWKLISNHDGVGVKSITYYPANCRYCFNIGRQHRSNGTFWTVNFERNEFYQKCFDPECRGVSSNLFPLPSFIANSLHKKDDKSTTLGADKDVIPFDEDDVESFFDESYTELNEFFSQWDNIFEQ